MVKLPFAWTFINDSNSTLGKAYEIKCGSVRCMLGKKNKRVYQSCVTTHQRLVFLYLSLIMMLALLKVGLGMLVVGLGMVMVGFKLK